MGQNKCMVTINTDVLLPTCCYCSDKNKVRIQQS